MVLDSCGIGAMPDARQFGDQNPDTLGNTAKAVGGLKIPNLQALGLGNIHSIEGVPKTDSPKASWGKLALQSHGKDTTTGHWEMAGIILEKGFKLYPQGFPQVLLDKFVKETGCGGVLCNKPYSGTEVIKDFGEEHLKTKFPIVYTSADSVFQIAAHEEIIPLDKLYEWCKITRKLCDDYQISRVIARPFIGSAGSFDRTENRKDFSALPPEPTLLQKLHDANVPVISIGKISDIFSGQGVTHSFPVKTNPVIMEETIDKTNNVPDGLIFSNLVDFDMKFGHRRDPQGYANALHEFDKQLPRLLEAIGPEDLLIITADHGCDPTHPGTDHTREYVPLLVYSSALHKNHSLGTRKSLSDIGKTIAENFGVLLDSGTSFLKEILPS